MSKGKYFWLSVRQYLPSFKKSITNKRGSPTLEYVVIIAAGAALAGLLLLVFDGGENNDIFTALKQKVSEVIGNSANPSGGDTTPPPNGTPQ